MDKNRAIYLKKRKKENTGFRREYSEYVDLFID